MPLPALTNIFNSFEGDRADRIRSFLSADLPAAGEQWPRAPRLLWILSRRTVREFQDDDCMHMAAGVAYYALFSLFPLVLGVIAVLGVALEPRQLQDRVVTLLGEYLPGSSELVSATITSVISSRQTLGVLAVVGLLWSASAVFAAIRRSMNRAWDVPKERPLVQQKLIELGMVFAVGLLVAASLASAVLLRLVDRLADEMLAASIPSQAALGVGGAVTTFLAVLIIYRFVPNARVAWAEVWPAAIVVTAALEGGKRLFLWYVETQALQSYSLTYGPLAAVMVLLLWAYLSAVVLLAGAELASEYGRLRAELTRRRDVGEASRILA